MSEYTIAVGDAKKLTNDADDSVITVEETIRTIKDIYNTFDALKTSWKGEKSDYYKKILEEVKTPLLGMCALAEHESTKLSNVGKIISDYHRR